MLFVSHLLELRCHVTTIHLGIMWPVVHRVGTGLMHLAGILILQSNCPYCEDCSNNNELWIMWRNRDTLYYAFVCCKRDYLKSHRSARGQPFNIIGNRKSAPLPCLTVSFPDLNTVYFKHSESFRCSYIQSIVFCSEFSYWVQNLILNFLWH